MTANDLQFVHATMRQLRTFGAETWLFGGWAEELRGMIRPRGHHDVDLLYPSDDFRSIDEFLANEDSVQEIRAKRFPHKRAFERDNIMVELILVQRDSTCGHYTDFWDTNRHRWPSDLLQTNLAVRLPVASAASLHGYRASFDSLRPTLNGEIVTAELWSACRGDHRPID